MVKNPIVSGVVVGVACFLTSSIISLLTRGSLNLDSALLDGLALAVVISALVEWQNKKNSKRGSDGTQRNSSANEC